jgi:signal transduction histidine kinase
MFSSLRRRVMLSHFIVILLAMGLAALTLLSFVENYFWQSTESSLAAQARFIVESIAPDALATGPEVVTQSPLNNAIQQQTSGNLFLQTNALSQTNNGLVTPPLNNLNLADLTNTSLQIGAQLATRIRILDANGLVIVDSANTDLAVDFHTDTLIKSALQGQYASRIDTTSADPTITVALPITSNGNSIGAAYLSQSLRDVLIVLNDLRLRLIVSTLIALAFSLVAGWWLSRRIAQPIQQLTIAAESVARGEFDQPVKIQSQDEIGRLGHTFNDMTSRLQSARQMQVDLVADVSHELRTPLTSIKGTIETLRGGAIDDLAVRDRFLQTVETETDRLIRLVNDLLVLSRADSAALNLHRQSIDLGQLVQKVAARLSEQAKLLNLSMRVEVEPNVPTAWADADRIEQVLLNLLDNALKYSKSNGSITLRVNLAKGSGASDNSQVQPSQGSAPMILVQVCDEGIGIPAAELDRIGQRFYRADKSRTRGGHGLGLAIAQSLIEAHGGELWLESEEGVGTTANFTLPTI